MEREGGAMHSTSGSVGDWMARSLYWGFAGAALGVGIIALGSIGWFLLMLALGLGVFGVFRLGRPGSWAIVLGFGLAPAFILYHDIQTRPPLCPGGILSGSGSSSTGPVCGGSPGSYAAIDVLAVVFGSITLLGLLLGLVALVLDLRRRRVAAAPTTPGTPGVPRAQLQAGSSRLLGWLRALALFGAAALCLAVIVGGLLVPIRVPIPALFLGVPLALVDFILTLLLGPRGLLGSIVGFVALEMFVALFFSGFNLVLAQNCGDSNCVGGQLIFRVDWLILAQTVSIALIGGIVGLALRALFRPRMQPPIAAA